MIALLAIASPAASAPQGVTRPAAAPPLPPVASYRIEVALDKAAHTIAGHELITYTNASSLPITELGWHLYLNAFSSEDTLFMRESGGVSRGFIAGPESRGSIEVHSLRLGDGTPLAVDPRETVMTTTLPAPLAPGATVTLTVDFTSRLPLVFARTGYYEDFVLAGQWFPKLAVHDDRGWHNFEFHANSEFFADFGTYDVILTVPAGDVVGATGVPVGEPVVTPAAATVSATQTLHFHAEDVIDFVWTASPGYRVAGRQIDGIDVVLLYQPESEGFVETYLDTAESSLRIYGRKYGAYPYPRLTIVDPPYGAQGAGGMEYPMFITGSALGAEFLSGVGGIRLIEQVTAHEIGHEWFGMTIASNEAEEPWLDEGFTEFASGEALDEMFGAGGSFIAAGPFSLGMRGLERFAYLAGPHTPMYGKAWELDNYQAAAYSKPALALTTLKGLLGTETFDRVMATYAERYRFRHPTTADFRAVAEEVSGRDLSFFFDQVVYGSGLVDYAVTGVSAHEVVVTRIGDVILPVTVRVTFADGSTRDETWDGAAVERRFAYPQNIVTGATVDPERVMALDVDVSNDSLANATVPPAEKALWRWLFWMQNILMPIGGLG